MRSVLLTFSILMEIALISEGKLSEISQLSNRSLTVRSGEISIDDLLLLNRHFVDYLAELDDRTAQNSEDSECVIAMRQLAHSYLDRQKLGIEWFDSWGKVPSGLYHQNGYAMGNVDQCRGIQQVRMQHCTFVGTLPGGMQPLTSGLCLPQSCSASFTQQLYGEYLSTQGVQLVTSKNPAARCIRDEEIIFSGAVVTAIIVASIVALCVLGSTSYELICEILNRDCKPLYTSFSLLGNMRSILKLVPRGQSKQQKSSMIECAHGIRSLSMLWIVVLHVNESLRDIPWENNPRHMEYTTKGFAFSFLYFSGTLAVDTFFVLSGMLVAIGMLRELDKNGKINPLKLYLHRYIRITAPLAALILFVVSFAEYMGEGVLWKTLIDRMKQPCVSNWWASLLHVQNYVDARRMCMPWTWYLSADMQLYIIAPALVYPLWRYGKRALIIVASLAVLSMTSILVTFLVKELRLSIFTPNNFDRYSLSYYTTHTRMAVWLWGLAFGYVLHTTKHSGVKLPKRYWTLGWVACLTLVGLIIFANYMIHTTSINDYSYVVDAFYEPLSRSVFGFCVIWIILACVNGKGGLLDEFLGASIWQPLSRLSFTMYLLHNLLILMASVAPIKTSLYFSVVDVFYRIWGAIGITTSVALLWSAIFELPFVTLSKFVLRN